MKILTLSDDPRLPSGVGTQALHLFKNLAEKHGHEVFSIGGGYVQEPNPDLKQPVQMGERFRILTAINNYGNPDIIRTFLDMLKPDCLFFITDPRFYNWLWRIENEVHKRNMFMAYWHVWDNDPPPYYNWGYYRSTDVIGCISKLTHNIVQDVLKGKASLSLNPFMQTYSETDEEIQKRVKYIPHAVPTEIFYPVTPEMRHNLRQNMLKNIGKGELKEEECFFFFWSNRNALRKRIADLLDVLKETLKEKPEYKNKVFLLLHSDPLDSVGQNLYAITEVFDLSGNVIFSKLRLGFDKVREMYNLCDCTLNVASSEGFGLSSLESQMCGRAVINNRTGGLKDQTETPVPFATRVLQGGGETPYIYDDVIDKSELLKYMLAMIEEKFTHPKEFEDKWRKRGEEVKEKFKMEKLVSDWNDLLLYGYANREKFYSKYAQRFFSL